MIQINMDMPNSCEECAIKTWTEEGYVCPFSGIPALNIGRQLDCPLRESERKEGKWIAHPNKEFKEWDVCTACGVGCKRREYEGGGMTEYNYLYCPNCGADMRQGDTE